MSSQEQLIVADIGGTNSRFACCVLENDTPKLTRSKWFATSDFTSFRSLFEAALSSLGLDSGLEKIDKIVVAAAGPISASGVCNAPNIDWPISKDELGVFCDFVEIELINDFVAQAYGIISIESSNFVCVHSGDCSSNSPRAIIGVGTGLGIATVIPGDDNTFSVIASEGAHTSFPIESKAEVELLEFISKKDSKPYVEWEDLISGNGIETLYSFFQGKTASVEQILSEDKACEQTLRTFSKLLGRLCRNFTLEVLARGGLYLSGGILAKHPQLVFSNEFRRSFTETTLGSSIVEDIPVWLVEQEDIGLLGAAVYGFKK